MQVSCLTWNILAPIWVDCKDYKMKNCGILETKIRREKIIKNICKYDADIVMLQEVTQREYNLMKKKLPQYKVLPLVPHRKKWAHDESGNKIMANGNCILLKKGMFDKIKSRKVQLNEDGVMASICECRLGEKRLVVVSMHLDDMKRSVRNVQLRKMVGTLREKRTEGIIMGGDFNDRIKYVTEKLLTKDGYTSVMQEITPTYYDTSEYNVDNIYLKRVGLIDTFIPRFKSGKDIIKKIGSDHSMIYTVVSLKP